MKTFQLIDVDKIFKKYDYRSHGYIDAKHTLTIFKSCGQLPSVQVEQEIIDESNQTGKVAFL